KIWIRFWVLKWALMTMSLSLHSHAYCLPVSVLYYAAQKMRHQKMYRSVLSLVSWLSITVVAQSIWVMNWLILPVLNMTYYGYSRLTLVVSCHAKISLSVYAVSNMTVKIAQSTYVSRVSVQKLAMIQKILNVSKPCVVKAICSLKKAINSELLIQFSLLKYFLIKNQRKAGFLWSKF